MEAVDRRGGSLPSKEAHPSKADHFSFNDRQWQILDEFYANGRIHDRRPGINRPKPFFLLSIQRCGTTALGRLLRAHPENQALPEILHCEKSWYCFWEFAAAVSLNDPLLLFPTYESRELLFSSYVDFMGRILPPCRSFVMDIKYNQMHSLDPIGMHLSDRPYILSLIREKGWPVLHLVRRNLLAVWVAGCLAGLNQRPAADLYAKPYEIDRVRIDAERSLAWVKRRNDEINVVRGQLAGTNHIELAYEDMFDGPLFADAFIHDLSAFMNLAPDDFSRTPQTTKVSPPLQEAIENIDDVRAVFAPTEFAWMVGGNISPPPPM